MAEYEFNLEAGPREEEDEEDEGQRMVELKHNEPGSRGVQTFTSLKMSFTKLCFVVGIVSHRVCGYMNIL